MTLGSQPALQLLPSPPFYLNQTDYSDVGAIGWEGNVKYIQAFESCLKFLSSVKFLLYGCHSLNSLLTKNPIMFLWEFQFAGVWKDSAFDKFLLKSSCHSHWGTRCWRCVWKIHYILSRLICKRTIRFLKVMIQKKPFFKKNLHWSIIFVFHKMSALLLFGNFD